MKKIKINFRVIALIGCLSLWQVCLSQNEGISSVGSLNIVKEIKPPILQMQGQVLFSDENNNNVIDADERCTISLTVKNTGMGDGYGLKAVIRTKDNVPGVKTSNLTLPTIKVGDTYTVQYPIESDLNTVDGTAEFLLSIEEPNGFNLPEVPISITTRAFQSPMVEFRGHIIESGAVTLTKNTVYKMQVLIQNTGLGTAEQVNVDLVLPEGVVLLGQENALNNATLGSGQTHTLKYSFIIPQAYNSTQLPVTIRIREKHGKYNKNGYINFDIRDKEVIAQNSIKPNISIVDPVVPVLLGSDVDKNIPKTNVKNENTFAFIIANQNYKSAIDVPFALNDGRVFKEYCIKTLGIDEMQVNLYEDATMGDLYNCINKIKNISNAYDGDANIIFYYAGHAFPDEKTKASYLLPVDGDGKTTAVAYSLNNLYKELSSVKTKNVLCFIDACFSGATRDGEVLVAGRGVAIRPKEETPLGNIIVFSSATGEETAHQYKKQQHGLFTYFLLKKLQETKGDVTLGDLGDYINKNVRRTSIKENNKPQTPTVIPSQALQDKWQKIKL